MEFSTSLRKTFLVRFIGVTNVEIETIRKSLGITHKSLQPYEDKLDAYVLVYDLIEEMDGKLVADCLKLQASITCDVFVSVRTDNDSQTVAIPRYVTTFVTDAGVELIFSFTVA